MPFQLPVGIDTSDISDGGTTIYYPQVTGLTNRQVQERINRIIYNQVNGMIRDQEKYQTGTPTEMVGHYEIKTNERGLLSLTLTNYAFSDHMAHGFTLLRSLTFNVNSGKLYRLSDLFSPGSDYVKVISRSIDAQIKARGIPVVNPFTAISPEQEYYLADKAMVIYFQLYELAPYYWGFPMFPISVYELQPMAPDQSPISILAADIS